MQNTRHSTVRNLRRGFTLIELLVVVLILAILMSIALPLYLSAEADSEKKTCRSNLQTIANSVEAARVHSLAVDYGALITGGVTIANLPDLNSLPLCPDAGSYTLLQGISGDNTTFKVQCSILIHGTFEPGVDNN
jgi:type IV pilus assembly protein PilA